MSKKDIYIPLKMRYNVIGGLPPKIEIQRRFLMKKAVIVIIILLIAAAGVFAFCKMQNDKSAFTVNDTLPDGENRHARVILLGGQSNASGCSRDDYLQKNVSEEKYTEYKNGYDNVYINYYVSGYNSSNGFVKCAAMQGEGGGFFGPELGLAEKLNEMYPGETFFIIKCAWGGTNLFEQWLSPSGKGKTGDLYLQFVDYVNTSLEYLESKNYDIEIEAMCWMQGESDSFSVENATDYAQNLSNFISDIREEFKGYASRDGIAFVDAYIADNPVFWVYCDLVNASKRTVADLSPMNALVDTVSLGLSCSEEPADSPDLAHYDSLSEIKLGNMFAVESANFFD